MSEEQVKYQVEADDRPAPTVTAADVSAAIAKVDYHVLFGTTITICVLTLQNGFTITGQSACASLENFNQVIGQDYAYLDAKEKVWQYLGYELKTAVGTSVFIMTFTALTGAASHFYLGGMPDLLILALCMLSTLFFARVAAVFANKASAKTLNRALGVVLTVLGAVIILVKLF